MKTIFRLLSFLLCATVAMLWLLANAYAQSADTNICAILAGRITSDISMQIKPADHSILQQMIRRQIYVNCVQTRGQQGAPGVIAPGQPGTNTRNAGAFVTFDVPGSTITNPRAINPPGAVTGDYFDAGDLIHSFLRTSDGTITAFDPPGATCSLSTQNTCSNAVGIAPDGTIVGGFADANGPHGYLRAANGAFTVFDAPNSVFTFPGAINPDGAVTGGFFLPPGGSGAHGFLRAPDGTFTTFDPLGSKYTQPNAINPAGAITGLFMDAGGVPHGFLRTSDGTITAFDPVGSTDTEPAAINPAGAITGSYNSAASGGFPMFHGFLRAPNGTITAFDASADSPQTVASGINPAGTIVGDFFTADFSAEHGFLRAADGSITVFDPPGSLFTAPTAINPAGVITGDFVPPDFSADHGFLGRP
jgi:uncharacterized membrane protein